MGGAPIAAGQKTVSVVLQQTPLQTAKVSVFVFEDDSPLNGEVDVHGGTDAMGSAREPASAASRSSCSMTRAAPATPRAR